MGKAASLPKQSFEGWLSDLQINDRAFKTIRPEKSRIRSLPSTAGFQAKTVLRISSEATGSTFELEASNACSAVQKNV